MSFISRRHNFKLAYRSLKMAKGRNMLTMLGIIIGVMSVVLVVCIGEGVKRQISGQLGHYGKQVFIIQPSEDTAAATVFSGLGSGGNLLSQNDVKTVQQTSGVAYAVPLATSSGSVSGDYTVATPFVVATNADFPQIINQHIQYGGFFDGANDSKTVVLGATLASQLFSNDSPLGQQLTWRGQHFIVAGVFDDFAAPPFSLEANFNNAMFVPYSTAQSLSKNVIGIHQILAKSSSASNVVATASAVNKRLVASHGGATDVQVAQAIGGNTASDQTIHLLTMLIVGAAAIALVVGGIGIMNVMLVSVTERMHEIGIRKAIGATNRQIMRQFAAEAFMLSTVGAVIGLVLSAAAVGLLRAFSSLQPVIVWQVMIIAPVVAIAVGLLFGSLPALKAARKDPIEALRQE